MFIHKDSPEKSLILSRSKEKKKKWREKWPNEELQPFIILIQTTFSI